MQIQMSMFDFETDPINEKEKRLRRALMRGSGFENGCLRIYAAADKYEDKEFADFLKEEFGTGGCSLENGFCDYSSRGFSIRQWREDTTDTYSWSKIATVYREMISKGLFPDDETKHKDISQIPIPRVRYPYEVRE